MHYDLSLQGPVILFSWPSQGSATGYANDEANLLWSQQDIEHFLIDLLEQTDLTLNLMAHSLGNRALTQVVIKLFREHPQWTDRINAVILAAPDIDAGYFERTVGPELVNTGLPITMYVSSNDIALKASKKIHGNPRAGENTEHIVIVPGMETIDASQADAELLGHEYYYQGPLTIADLYEWLVQGLSVAERTHLKGIQTLKGQYWELQPANN
jgi:esterase/lipase superfamily enzyme